MNLKKLIVVELQVNDFPLSFNTDSKTFKSSS